MEDRSALFNQLKNFSQRKLKKVETKVVTGTGEQLVEKRGAKGLQVLDADAAARAGQESSEPARKLDLQVGLIVPGLLIASEDVAHDKSSLDSYGVTHILSLDAGVTNKYEDDYNYKNISMRDEPDYSLEKIFDECFDFVDDGRHYGNVLIHCAGTKGLSRSTAICIAYLMDKEKQKFDEAYSSVKEARSFVRPNDGFIKQLKEFEVKLRGAQQVKDSGIDDPFALRKKQEIEQEKAMVAGAASVKNRMKMFGSTLDTNSSSATNRSKSVSPSPYKDSSSSSIAKSPISSSKTDKPVSKWSISTPTSNNSISKSMTPEPRKSATTTSSSQKTTVAAGPPPPPPPMPANLDALGPKKKTAAPPPPPPPPAQAFELSSSNDSVSSGNRKTVFGRVPPPPMKIKGGLSIEKNDAVADRNIGFSRSNPQSKASLQLPLKKQFTIDSEDSQKTSEPNPRAPSPSAALRAAKQQVSAAKNSDQPSNLDQARPSVCGQLNRSSTKKLLNLIKTKTKTDLTLSDGDENDEIDALLASLENEAIENIDWDELGLDEDEVKDIIQGEASSHDSTSGDDEETEEEEEEEVEVETQHFVIRTK